MNKLGIAIGAAITAAGIAGMVYYGKKLHEQKEQEKDIPANDNKTLETTVVTPIDRIKEAAMKKAVRIMGWVVVHEQQLQAAGTVIGLAATVFQLINGIKEYKLGKDLHKKLDILDKRIKDSTNKLGMFADENFKIMCHNLKVVDNDIIAVANKVGAQIEA